MMPGMYAYLAGPMTGYPNFNYDAFDAAAKQLRALGLTVFNPTETSGGDQSHPYAYYCRKDSLAVLDVDCVIVLPGWEESAGARLEVALATGLGLATFSYDDIVFHGGSAKQLWEPNPGALKALLNGRLPEGTVLPVTAKSTL